MKNMTEERLARLKEILEDHKLRLRRSLSARIDEIRAHDHDGKLLEGLDPADASAADLEQACGVVLAEMASEALGRVDQALARLEHGEYGVCSDCDTPIAGKRLQAIPFAVRCRACEELHESREHARRSSRRSHDSLLPRVEEPLRLASFDRE
jgi:DnaK suppressor protein